MPPPPPYQPDPPPGHVLAAFGVAGSALSPLGGGQGTSWHAGDLVLKPVDVGPDELAWRARIYPRITCAGFRLPQPQATRDGSLSAGGWCATRYQAGHHEPRRWAGVISAGERFHAALRGIPRPAFLGTRSSPWAVSDRVAWGEIPASEFPAVSRLPRLTAAIRPLDAPSQLVHGDLSGNVLFHGRLPPVILDFSPYWRPVAYGPAIVVADALVWEGAGGQILGAVRHIGDFGQYLLRALIFREVTDWLCRQERPSAVPARGGRWEAAAELACQLAM